MFIFGARKFHFRRTWNEKPAPKMELIYGAGTGSCVTGLRGHAESKIVGDKL